MVKKKIGISHDLIIHPGETIADILVERGITQQELAIRTGVSPAYVSSIINGKKDISSKFAMSLEYALGVRKQFWLNLQANYDAELLEFNELETVSEQELIALNHLTEIIKYLRERALLDSDLDDENCVLSLRKLLKISDINNLSRLASDGAFRLAEGKYVDGYVLGAWIRMCQIAGEEKLVDTVFDSQNVHNLILELKHTMLRNSENMQADITDLMSRYGIDFSIVHHFKGAPVHGYVSFNKNGAYQMCVTLRGSYADQFWFSLFHEIGHIVNGDISKTVNFIDDGNIIEQEVAANNFAENALLDFVEYKRFIEEKDFSLSNIICFAVQQQVMPYIVIGRLRREKLIEHSKYEEHMLRYQWEN